ncbi:FAD-binding oxidoreductase [Pseudomonas gingeri]|uniref:FAD-binding oxidoreductase n=1 Tax=Pseudomonas gingeri TaxID=117681 RepID=UPI0015A2EADF|nr:FAD-binding oxidoreductase [Pseudomonas gingeri]NWA02624.1 2Fe-2S iron-sulfur cluster binding domain-containing protein [Pseudomonas gingeri]NWA12203.1 2Fe-2S iron-sulfur cluster binding domain-containing protein [Pseudomonas gingeri]NWA57391.1 2Fe-2S iron-sulfur cluster binding domain-containing protein [Pseudomonas gingeri]NWA93734.1 2Fe-2S iron-sulfur cluster binding domain-containing protein [Pseudomonas gingeri]NWB03206.1 2Fe-2S iron-sulfur cluster binding domain-containing protein [Ps
MPEQNLMDLVAGYREARQAKQTLEQTGTDFHEVRGEVGGMVVQLHPKRLQLEVAEIIEETASTRTLRVVAADRKALPPFLAGQYINLFVDIDGVATARPYAISSSPSQPGYYDLTVKRARDGYVSHYLLDRVVVGQRLLSSGPMGTFHHNPLYHGDDLVFLAGGSGSAPARSILEDLLDRGLAYRFHLIYVNSHLDDVIFDEAFRALARKHGNFTLTHVISRPPADYQGHRGRLSQALLQDLLGDVGDKMFYICGPTPFNDHCIALLTALDVKRRRIRVEANGAPNAPEEQPGWPQGVALDDEVTVTVQGRGAFKSRVGEPLLNALERNGYFAENACRSGECSLCRIKLVSGSVFNPREAHLRKSDRDFDWFYSCVAFATADIEILL